MKKIMNHIALSVLLVFTPCLHGLRGVETSTQKAIKKHKVQQQKSARKANTQFDVTISQWALLAQRQPNIDKSFKKGKKVFKPFCKIEKFRTHYKKMSEYWRQEPCRLQ